MVAIRMLTPSLATVRAPASLMLWSATVVGLLSSSASGPALLTCCTPFGRRAWEAPLLLGSARQSRHFCDVLPKQ